MNNAEKYKEVFGLSVDPSMCPTTDCDVCPCAAKDSKGYISCVSACTYEWWNKEYKDIQRPQGEWFDCIEKKIVKARHGDYVLYNVDFLLDNLTREVYIMEGARKMRGGAV